MTRRAPYIGITGIQEEEDLQMVIRAFEEHDLTGSSKRRGMVGFLASENTLRNDVPLTTRHVDSLPKLRQLIELAHERVLAMIHFEITGLWGNKSPCLQTVSELLQYFASHSLYPAVQLNGTPNPTGVYKINDAASQNEIVLQLRPELIQKDTARVTSYIRQCLGAPSHALIDPSCGTGKEFDVSTVIPLLQHLEQEFPDITFGIAGGLSPQNVEERMQVVRALLGHANFSIDIEGKVRDPTTDRFDTACAAVYIANAAKALK